MCHEYKLVLTNAVICYPASMVNLIWFANEKNVYWVSTEQHGDMKSGVSRSKNATILQARRELVHCLARTCESPAIFRDT